MKASNMFMSLSGLFVIAVMVCACGAAWALWNGEAWIAFTRVGAAALMALLSVWMYLTAEREK
jgi:hypothetical protein